MVILAYTRQFEGLTRPCACGAQGFHKAVKKHDKQLPHAPCQQFYMHILRTQPWVQGDQSSLLIKLSAIYAQLRGQPAEAAVEQARLRSQASALLLAMRTVRHANSVLWEHLISVAIAPVQCSYARHGPPTLACHAGPCDYQACSA